VFWVTIGSNTNLHLTLINLFSVVENMVKKPQLFSHCGSFDHPDLQLLNNCGFVIFGFTTAILKLWGHVIHRWKGIFKKYIEVY